MLHYLHTCVRGTLACTRQSSLHVHCLDADELKMDTVTSECALSKSCCSWRLRASAWLEAVSASRSAAAAHALSWATLRLAFCLSLSIMSCMTQAVMGWPHPRTRSSMHSCTCRCLPAALCANSWHSQQAASKSYMWAVHSLVHHPRLLHRTISDNYKLVQARCCCKRQEQAHRAHTLSQESSAGQQTAKAFECKN